MALAVPAWASGHGKGSSVRDAESSRALGGASKIWGPARIFLFLVTSLPVVVDVLPAWGQPGAGDLPDAVPSAEIREAIVWGLNWLVGKQRSDGSWGNPQHPGMTALVLLAFVRAEHHARLEVLQRGTAFVLSCAEPDGGIYRKDFLAGGRSTYNTAVCVTTLSELKDPALTPFLLKARRFLAQAQCGAENGPGLSGFAPSPYSPYRAADVHDTLAALEALHASDAVEAFRPEGEAPVRIDREAAAAFLWDVALKGETSDISAGFATSRVVSGTLWAHLWWGLCMAGGAGTEEQMNLFRERFLEPVSVPPPDATIESLWRATQALACEAQSTHPFLEAEKRLAWRQGIAARLLAARHTDPARAEAWWTQERSPRAWEKDPVLSTAYAILALERLLISW